ncbi:MAG: sulfatase [Anaerolineaceae bacterium]|nr:sulfatase [Anaerolineaceae bacterium]
MSDSRPNLIFVLADQLRLQSCGHAGDARAQTPHIERLAAESVDYRNCVSGSPMCAPYRASLFTGKYSSSTGMVINELRLSPQHRALGHVLGEGGYATAYIGKWHLWANQLGHHDEPRNSFTPPGPHRLGFDGFWASYGFHHNYWDQYYHRDSPQRITLPGYEPDSQTDLAIAQLQQLAAGERPFALFLSWGTPHDPWGPDNVPEAWLMRFRHVDFELPPNYRPENDPHADAWARLSDAQRQQLPEWMRVYYAMTANLDWNLGRLLEALEASGARSNTIVVFTSDHGEMFGAQGRRAKNIFYEEAVRVPFLLRWPGTISAGRVTDVPLNTPDIMPTLLSLLDLPVPPEVEGTSLAHCALGAQGPEPSAAFLQGMGATAIFEDGHEWRALRSRRHTYATYRADGEEHLYDNLADPCQQRNLAQEAAQRELLLDFRQQLSARMNALDDRFESCCWYRDHWIEDRVIQQSRVRALR